MVYLTVLGAIELGLLRGDRTPGALVPWPFVLLALAVLLGIAAVWSMWYLLRPRTPVVGSEIRLALTFLLMADAALLATLFLM